MPRKRKSEGTQHRESSVKRKKALRAHVKIASEPQSQQRTTRSSTARASRRSFRVVNRRASPDNTARHKTRGRTLKPPSTLDYSGKALNTKSLSVKESKISKGQDATDHSVLTRANPLIIPPEKSWMYKLIDFVVRITLLVALWIIRHVTLICAGVLFIFSLLPDDHHLTLDPPMMLAIMGIWYIIKSFWAGLPRWLVNKLDPNAEEDLEEEDSVENLTSPQTILAKLNEMFELAYTHTNDIPLPRFKIYVCFLTLLHFLRELSLASPKWRDQVREEEGEAKISLEELETLQLYMEFADLAYIESPTELILKLNKVSKDGGDSGYRLLRHDVATEPGRVGHFIAVHYERKEVVISIKGTSSFSDVLTDLVGKAIPHELPNGTTVRCHEGMHAAAERMLLDTQHLIETFFLPAGYSIFVCGHSLGAGVSCLLGTFLHAANIPVQVKAFATPACLSFEAATSEETKSYMTSVVNNDDCVPRVSLVTIRSLMELFCFIDNKLVELGRSPTSWRSTRAYLRDITRVDDQLLMSPEELEEAKAKCREDDIQVDSLFVAGRVVSMWECYASETEKPEESVVDSRQGDGGMGTLRGIEVSTTMVSDHGTENYKSNLKRLIDRAKKEK